MFASEKRGKFRTKMFLKWKFLDFLFSFIYFVILWLKTNKNGFSPAKNPSEHVEEINNFAEQKRREIKKFPRLENREWNYVLRSEIEKIINWNLLSARRQQLSPKTIRCGNKLAGKLDDRRRKPINYQNHYYRVSRVFRLMTVTVIVPQRAKWIEDEQSK